MTLDPVDVLSVGRELKDGTTLPVGRLGARRRRIFFEFDPAFLRSGLPLSPYKLPLEPGVHVAKESIFDGLFGVFNDSLPDGWGLLLLDRQLRRRGIEPGALTPLDRLAMVGSNAMGALRYEPDRATVRPYRSGAVHMHTASGLLHTDHRLPSLDYDNLLKAARWLTRDMTEVEKLYRLAVFNVFSHNRDDHPKNVSFLMDNTGRWCVSPAYDLTFSAGPGGEHSMMIAGEGLSPGQSHLQRLGTDIGIARNKVLSIIEEVATTVASWPTFAAHARVSEEKAERMQQVLNRIALQVQK